MLQSELISHHELYSDQAKILPATVATWRSIASEIQSSIGAFFTEHDRQISPDLTCCQYNAIFKNIPNSSIRGISNVVG